MNRWWPMFFKLCLTLLVAVGLSLVYLNAHLSRQFQSLSWAVGAKIYARPLELFQGAPFSLDQTRFELDLLNYRVVSGRPGRGQYQQSDQALWIGMRGHQFPDGLEPDRLVRVAFQNGQVAALTDQSVTPVDIIRFEPLVLAQLSGTHADREIIDLSDLPADFIKMLIAVEDRAFFDHAGISITGIMLSLIHI